MAHQPVALFGESGAGNMHLVRSLTHVIRIQLSVIQFHMDTDSSPIIGSLEINGNAEEVKAMRKEIGIGK
jgi:ABC-type phosphate/phosphonate transport system ATPase subunit